MKPRIRVKAPLRMLGRGVPDDAQPNDLILGNRGAGAIARLDERLRVLYLEYAGNFGVGLVEWKHGKVYDER